MDNFEAAGVFLSDQIAALRTKNIGSHPSRLATKDSRKNDRRNSPHKKSQKSKRLLGKQEWNEACMTRSDFRDWNLRGLVVDQV